MGREIISDDVNLAPRGVGGYDVSQKIDESGTGMALTGLAEDFCASGIKGSVQRRVPWR